MLIPQELQLSLRTFTQRRGMQFHALHMILAVWELGSV